MTLTEQIFLRKEDIPLDQYYPVIWLASWYPSNTYPTNGDFIQRHAQTVSAPLLVVHTIHSPDIRVNLNYLLRKSGKLTELIIQFRQEHEGPQVFQRLLYHYRFKKYTQDLLKFLIKKNGRPVLFHVHVPMKMGPIALWAKRKWGIPYAVSEQSSKYVGDGPDHFIRRSPRHRQMVARVFREAFIVTNVSYTVGQILKQLFNLKTVQTIYNVADPSIFFPGEKRDVGTYRFIHASTLTTQKNIDGIIRTMDGLYQARQDFTLTILGGEAHADYSWKNNQPWLIHVPTVSHERVADYMRSADALLMFSVDENFPCVIPEALSSGLVVITSDAGGSAEAIRPQNGRVVPVGDETALAAAIQEVIDHRSGFNAVEIRNDSVTKFSNAVIGKQFMDLYQSAGVSFT